MMTVCYVLGPPGVGKTTATRLLLEETRELIAKPKWTVGPKIVAAGHYSGATFDGADTVPYNGVNDCLQYWEDNLMATHEVTFLDGDRFSHAKTKLYFETRAERVCAVILKATDEHLQRRRDGRGSNQNPTWLKGRVTKALRFFDLFQDKAVIDSNAGVAAVADDIRDFITKGKLQWRPSMKTPV